MIGGAYSGFGCHGYWPLLLGSCDPQEVSTFHISSEAVMGEGEVT